MWILFILKLAASQEEVFVVPGFQRQQSLPTCMQNYNLLKRNDFLFAICKDQISLINSELMPSWTQLFTDGVDADIEDVLITEDNELYIGLTATVLSEDNVLTHFQATSPPVGDTRASIVNVDLATGAFVEAQWSSSCPTDNSQRFIAFSTATVSAQRCHTAVQLSASTAINAYEGDGMRIFPEDNGAWVVVQGSSVAYVLDQINPVQWKHDMQSGVVDVQIFGGKIFVASERIIYCIDKTGEFLMRQVIPGQLLAFVVSEDGILISTKFNENESQYNYIHKNDSNSTLILISLEGHDLTYRSYSQEITQITTHPLTFATHDNFLLRPAPDLELFERLNCHSNCSRCFGPSSVQWLSCNTYEVGSYAWGDCAEHCKECSSGSDNGCIRWEIGWVLLAGGWCGRDLQCDVGFAPNYHSGQWDPCEAVCEEWNPEGCIRCLGGFSVLSTGCVANCPDRMVSEKGICLPCHETCASCSSSTPDACLTCIEGVLFLGRWVDICPAHSWFDGVICQPWGEHCAACTEEACHRCVDGSYLLASTCHETLPKGYFALNQIAVACPMNCDSCPGEHVCMECSEGWWLNSARVCEPVVDCGEASFFSSGQCHPCHSQCVSCHGPSEDECSEWVDTFLLQDTSCNVVKKEWSSGQYVTYENNCTVCDAKCVECSSQHTCTRCLEGYVHGDECVSTCPVGWHAEQTFCALCKDTCAIWNSADQCVQCEVGYLMHLGQCFDRCSRGLVERNGMWEECPENCSACTLEMCSSCKQSFYLDDGKCLPCRAGCLLCDQESQCHLCETGLYRATFHGKSHCVADCPFGTHLQGTGCVACRDQYWSSCPGDVCTKCKLQKAGRGRHKMADGIWQPDELVCLPHQTGPNCVNNLSSWNWFLIAVAKTFL